MCSSIPQPANTAAPTATVSSSAKSLNSSVCCCQSAKSQCLDAAQTAAKAEAGKGIDLVDVFRASDAVPGIVDDVIRLGIPYLWLQDGVQDDVAIARAEAAGVKCIQNDCIFREHAARA